MKLKALINVLTDTQMINICMNGFAVTAARLEMGLRQRVYPFGDAVEMKGGTWVYAVYSVLLERWIAERSTPNG